MVREKLLGLAKDSAAKALTEQVLNRLEPLMSAMATGDYRLRSESPFHVDLTAVTAIAAVCKMNSADLDGIRKIKISAPMIHPEWMSTETYAEGLSGCLKRPLLEMIDRSVSETSDWSALLGASVRRDQRPPTSHLESNTESAIYADFRMELDSIAEIGASGLLGIKPSSDKKKNGENLRRRVAEIISFTFLHAVTLALAGDKIRAEDLLVAVRLMEVAIPLGQQVGAPGYWCVLVK